jgi:two-component system, chemotaxis family, sensor kinase CheA
MSFDNAEKKDIIKNNNEVLNKSDDLMNLMGELVLGKNRLIKINKEVAERYDGEDFLEELNKIVSILSTVTTDLQIAVMKTRISSMEKIFENLSEIIKNLSEELDKKININLLTKTLK